MFKNETKQVSHAGRSAASRSIKALAAAASLGVMAAAGHASASQEIKISNVAMDTKYEANIAGFGAAYSNGVQFTAKFYAPGNPTNIGAVGTAVPDLFGFCIDIYHEIGLGSQSLFYNDNQGAPDPLATDNGGNPLSLVQQNALTNLVDTGYILHQQENASNHAFTEMQLAAIQAAIWEVEVPTVIVHGHTTTTVTLVNGGQKVAGHTETYQQLFNNYVAGNYVSLADANDRVYTITDLNHPAHQTFAIGWPVAGVPEPATWAMMLTGFFGMGSVLRRQRKARLAVAA